MMKTLSILRRLVPVVALFAALLGSAVQATPAYAASIVVNSNEDTDTGNVNDGKCTLREALIAANTDLPRGGCPAGTLGVDTISFAGNYTITVGSQLPFITNAITITGNGAANTIIQAAASPEVATWRVFQVTPTGNLTLNGVTVRNGRCGEDSCTVVGGIDPSGGSGIYNSGILAVTNSIISGNYAFTFGIGGGGIYNRGTLTVTSSAFFGNSGGEGRGGGIHNKSGNLTVTNSTFSGNDAGGIHNSGTLTVTNSTFSGNDAYDGGGGISNSGTATVTKSTFSGNNGMDAGGGGIRNSGTLSLTNSTLSMNSAWAGGAIINYDTLVVTNGTIAENDAFDRGGGISNEASGTVILTNTIVAGNNNGSCSGAVDDHGYNLDSGSTCAFDSNLSSLSNTDPMLGPLASNGGPTQTMALLAGSPAIDKIFGCSESPTNGIDQRGLSRPQGARCDIGAYEYNGSFWDVPLDYWATDYIEHLYRAGVTGGCAVNPLRYCPEGTVTRAQMAVFLLRGIHGSAYNPPAVGSSTGFADVPATYWAAAWIKQLAAEGITGGCGPASYCPESPVTRAQMAVFLLRSAYGAGYNPPPVGSTTGFSDVPANYWAAAWIKELVTIGITSGCGTNLYCPESPVTRAQMAVFLVRTFVLPVP